MKKTFNDKYGCHISLIANVFAILDTSIFNIIRYFLTDHEEMNILFFIIKFFADNWVVVLLFNCVFTLVCNIWVIPLYRIRKYNIPADEAKSSKLLTAFLSITIIVLICVEFNIVSNFAGYIDTRENVGKGKNKLRLSKENEECLTEIHLFTPEQILVDYYVPMCKQEVFSTEFWRDFKDKELEHILNGIYAYEGMLFKGEYYNIFKWYHGHIMSKDFTDDMLCFKQHKNIANIIMVLQERGLR